MSTTSSRRRFLRAAGGSAAALALASCAKQPEQPKQPDAEKNEVKPVAAAPSRPAAEVLSRTEFLEYLDKRAQANMEFCHHCAQASFLSLQQGFGLPESDILKALTPLPGIAERGETCGAVVGSLMALGLVFSGSQLGDTAAWQACLVPARAFCDRFEKELGSTQCGDLLEKHFGKRFDLANPAERAEFIGSNPGPSEICGKVVRTAVRLAAEIILDNRTPTASCRG
ncbi:MAG: C_GCAxxG_C_C family protein [Planctomycetes bacterium]|nr:C_GCAxxG_C_C family protein [Planctomycetota bacterium]